MTSYDKAAAAAELEEFKRAPLIELAVEMGWEITETNRSGATLKKGAVKIGAFKGDHCWMWRDFSRGNGPGGRASGTVVDLALEAAGTMGKARHLLRSLTGASAPTSPASTTAPVPSSTSPNSAFTGKTYKAPDEVLAEYKTGARIWRAGGPLPAFMSERGVDRVPDIFHGRFAVTDRHGAARFLFATFDENGKAIHAGVEDRNLSRNGEKSFRRYTTGGRAGFWYANGEKGAPVIVTESPLDAISCELLRQTQGVGRDGSSYVAVRSGAEDAVVQYLIRKIASGTRCVMVSTDNDAAGMAYASKIMGGLDVARKECHVPDDVIVLYMAPDLGATDWNEALMEHRAREARSEGKSSGGPSPRPEPSPAPRRPAPADTAPCPA